MVLTVIMEGISKATTVLSVLMKVHTIPRHDRCHINVMLLFQSCTYSMHILPCSSSEIFATSSDGAFDIGSIKVEKDVVVIEEGFTAINAVADVAIKQEEIPKDITFPDIKDEPNEVSFVCTCLLLDTFYQCPYKSQLFL